MFGPEIYSNMGVRQVGGLNNFVPPSTDINSEDGIKNYLRKTSIVRNVYYVIKKQNEVFRAKWSKLKLVAFFGIHDTYYKRLCEGQNMYAVQKIGTETVHILTEINLKLPYKYNSTDGCSYLGKKGNYFIYSIPKKYARYVNLVASFISKTRRPVEHTQNYYDGIHIITADGQDLYIYLAKHDTNKKRDLTGVFADYKLGARSVTDFVVNLENNGLAVPRSMFIEHIDCGLTYTKYGEWLKNDMNPELL